MYKLNSFLSASQINKLNTEFSKKIHAPYRGDTDDGSGGYVSNFLRHADPYNQNTDQWIREINAVLR